METSGCPASEPRMLTEDATPEWRLSGRYIYRERCYTIMPRPVLGTPGRGRAKPLRAIGGPHLMSVSSVSRVVGYVRVAASDQERQAPDSQRERLRRPSFASIGRDSLPPASRFYEDAGVSGLSRWGDCPGLRQRLRDAEAGLFDLVRIALADHLSRSRGDQ